MVVYSQLLRCSTARGSITGLFLDFPFTAVIEQHFLEWQPCHSSVIVFCLIISINLGSPKWFLNVQDNYARTKNNKLFVKKNLNDWWSWFQFPDLDKKLLIVTLELGSSRHWPVSRITFSTLVILKFPKEMNMRIEKGCSLGNPCRKSLSLFYGKF